MPLWYANTTTAKSAYKVHTTSIKLYHKCTLFVNQKRSVFFMAKSNKRQIGHVKKLDKGKYLLRLSLGYDDFGKRIQPSKVVECANDREAEKLLWDFYNERDSLLMQHTCYVPQTLGQLYDYWTKHHAKNLRERTAEWYAHLWSKHIKYAAQVKLDILSPGHIHKIIDEIEGARTKNAVYKALNAMLNKAVKWGFISVNPCCRIDTPKYKAPEKKTLTEQELHLIAEKIKDEELKYQTIFYFAVLCGMRRQEIIALKWFDIDFKNNRFKICRAAAQVTGKGTIPGKTKTDKSVRVLYLPELLKMLLLSLRQEQRELIFMYGDKWNDEDWIFTQSTGKLMHIQTPTHWWSEFAKANNIHDVTFHCLRHTAATYMIKNNVPISTVSGVLGHANITTTLNTYTHVIEDTKQTAINIMENLVSQNNDCEIINISRNTL